MGVLVIRPVPKDVARELVIKGHYSHKWLASFGIHNFGIFREGAEADEECLGVASVLSSQFFTIRYISAIMRSS